VSAETVVSIDAVLDEGGIDIYEEQTHPWQKYIPQWHNQALCVGMEDERFFGKRDLTVRPSLTLTELKKAQELCSVCPVYRACLTHSLTKPEEYGVWGGTSRNMRLKILKAVELGLVKVEDIVDELCDMQERIKESRGVQEH
jgi:WhiB family redox-sensing transcriptional regulator